MCPVGLMFSSNTPVITKPEITKNTSTRHTHHVCREFGVEQHDDQDRHGAESLDVRSELPIPVGVPASSPAEVEAILSRCAQDGTVDRRRVPPEWDDRPPVADGVLHSDPVGVDVIEACQSHDGIRSR